MGMGCGEIGECESGHGPRISRELQLPSFHSLKLSGNDRLILRQGAPQEVRVEGQQNIIELIRLDVDRGEWDIRTRGCVRRHQGLTYYVTIPEVRSLSLEGSGDIRTENILVSPEIQFEITGSGAISAEVEAQAVRAEVAGSGMLLLSGESEAADVEITGSGECQMADLRAQAVTVDIEGSGNAYVTALDLLKVDIKGSGHVYYRGQPAIHSSITGSGKLIKR